MIITFIKKQILYISFFFFSREIKKNPPTGTKKKPGEKKKKKKRKKERAAWCEECFRTLCVSFLFFFMRHFSQQHN